MKYPVGACKGSVMSSVYIFPVMKMCEMHVLLRLGLPFPTSRQLVALRREVPVPRQASAVAGMLGRVPWSRPGGERPEVQQEPLRRDAQEVPFNAQAAVVR